MKKDPTVLCIDYSYGFGGATKSTSLMYRALTGFDRYVLTCQSDDVCEAWYSAYEPARFRRLVNYRNRGRVRSWLQRSSLTRPLTPLGMKGMALLDLGASGWNLARIAYLIKTRKIDLIHLNNGFKPLEGLIAAKLFAIPCIVHMRDFYRPESVGRWSWAERYASLVIADSDAVAKSVERSSFAERSVETLYEAVDVTAFEDARHLRDDVRADLGLEPNDVAVGVFGRVIPWKGQDVFVRAAISAMGKNRRIKGIIVGDESDGAREYFRALKDRISASGLADRFTLTGYVRDVERYYAAMDIVVHSSVEPEPCGVVVLEAMAARKPVVATDIGGPRELIDRGSDGMLVAPGNVAELETAILELAKDGERRSLLGDAGFAKARRLFDVPIAAGRLAGLFRGLLNDKS